MGNIFCAAILIAAIIGSLLIGGEYPVAYYAEGSDLWYPIVHKSFNSFMLWQDDPIIKLLSYWIGTNNLNIVSIVISTIGIACLLVETTKKLQLSLLLSAIAFSLSSLHLWGFDLVLNTGTSWIPWLTLSLLLFFQEQGQKRIIGTLGTIIFSFCLIFSANYLCLLFFLVSILFAWTLRTPTLSFYQLITINFSVVPVLIVILLCILSAQNQFTPPAFPNYLSTYDVVSDNGLAGNILPLVGPTAPIPFHDREFMRQALSLFIMIFSCLSLSLWFKNRNKNELLNSQTLLLFNCFLIATDIGLPEALSQIAPIATLGRTLPYLFYTPIIMVWVWLSILYFIIHANRTNSNWHASILISLLLIMPSTALDSLAHGSFLNPEHNLPIEALNKKKAEGIENKATLKFYQSRLLSPSYAIYREHGLWSLEAYTAIKHGKFKHLRKFKAHISSSHSNQPELHKYLLDRKASTRWSTGGGKQTGNEWLLLQLHTAHWLYGIELDTGDFFTDYGRGVHVSYKANCMQEQKLTQENISEFLEVVNIPEWNGPIRFTSDDHAYRDSPNIVKIYFPKPIHVQCLLVQQTGKTSAFDWSIATIRLLRADKLD